MKLAFPIIMVLADEETVVPTLECDYTPGFAGSFYRNNGDPGDPPEPDEIQVNAVKLDGVALASDHPLVKQIDGLLDENGEFFEMVMDKAREAACDEKIAADEARYDALRDREIDDGY